MTKRSSYTHKNSLFSTFPLDWIKIKTIRFSDDLKYSGCYLNITAVRDFNLTGTQVMSKMTSFHSDGLVPLHRFDNNSISAVNLLLQTFGTMFFFYTKINTKCAETIKNKQHIEKYICTVSKFKVLKPVNPRFTH